LLYEPNANVGLQQSIDFTAIQGKGRRLMRQFLTLGAIANYRHHLVVADLVPVNV
jgi:hypothetical protein